MRLNPFSRTAGPVDSEEEEMAVGRLKRQGKRSKQQPQSPDTPVFHKAETPVFSDEEEEKERYSTPSRAHSRSHNRTPEAADDDEPESSPEAPRRRRHHASPERRAASSSPELERRPRGGGASKASSRRSKARALSSSEDEDEYIPMTRSSRSQRRKQSSHKRRGQSPARGRGRKRLESEEEESDQGGRSRRSKGSRRGKVVPLSTRRRSRSRSHSRGLSSMSDDDDEEELEEMPRQRPSRRKSGSHRPSGRGRESSKDPKSKSKPKTNSKKKKATPKAARSSWGFKMIHRKKQEDDDDDQVEVISEEPNYRIKLDAPRARDTTTITEARDPPPAPLRTPNRKAFANLYEYDNFPAIDPVPTAIGYHSQDDSSDGAEDDNKSFTSRYSVDVKSVRGRKLRRNQRSTNANLHNRYMDVDGDDNYSHDEHDEHDDKYAQYLAGVQSNAVLSDSSESCPPTWHPALDLEDSDWYDEDEEAAKKLKKQQSRNKKYQVSGKGKKSEGKSKKKIAVEEKKNTRNNKMEEDNDLEEEQEEQEEDREDAIVANRSEVSDMMPSNFSNPPAQQHQQSLDDLDEDDEDEMTADRSRRRKQRASKNRKKAFNMEDYDDDVEDETDYSELSNDETTQRNRKRNKARKPKAVAMNGNTTRGKKHNMKSMTKATKTQNKSKSLRSKLKGIGRFGGRRSPKNYASSSDESSVGVSERLRLAPTPSMYSEEPSRVDAAMVQLERDEIKESTATHNMIRNRRKEIMELDEMDEASEQRDQSMMCGAFPGLAGLTLGGASCFYGQSQNSSSNEIALDSIQMQRLKDAKYDLENKPKVEVILQDLQDPLAEKYDQLEKMQRKQRKEAQRQREIQQELEKREREELLQMKREMREAEQKKIHMAQNRDQLALQEAPDLNRGKSQSFVMDISDWVLNLDSSDPNPTPKKKPMASKDATPRTNGRDDCSSPIEKLPFTTIEVPTVTMDSAEASQNPAGRAWRRNKKKRPGSSASRQGATSAQRGVKAAGRQGGPIGHRRNSSQKQKETKKKGWFRKG